MNNAPLPPEQITSLLIRVNTLEQKYEQTHNQVQQVQVQVQQYRSESVPSAVNDLLLQTIRSSVERAERDMNDMKREIAEVKHELSELNDKLAKQESEAQKRDAAQRESQDKLQIRVLWFIVATVITVLSGVLIAFLTHFIP